MRANSVKECSQALKSDHRIAKLSAWSLLSFGLSQVSFSQVIAGHEPGVGRGQLPFLVGSLHVATLSCRVRDKW